MSKFYESYGRISYKNSWIVLECGRGIIEYYRYWLQFKSNIKIDLPYHGAHVTIVAGTYEDVTDHKFWKKYDGQIIKYEYDSFIKSDGNYFWAEVRSKKLEDIRRELDLAPTPKYPYHLTIGSLRKDFSLTPLKIAS